MLPAVAPHTQTTCRNKNRNRGAQVFFGFRKMCPTLIGIIINEMMTQSDAEQWSFCIDFKSIITSRRSRMLQYSGKEKQTLTQLRLYFSSFLLLLLLWRV
jgi:hypothetical protein